MAYEQFETAGMGAMNLGAEAASRFQTGATMGGFRATKDIEMERREQERMQVAQAERQQQMIRDAQAKQEKKGKAAGWGSLLGSIAGGVIGTTFGAPTVGATIGGGLGSSIGGMFGQEGGQVPQGKFLQSGWGNLQKREDFLTDQSAALERAMKPTLGTALQYGLQGAKTGYGLGSLAAGALGKSKTYQMAKAASEGPGGVSFKEGFKGAGGFGGILGDITEGAGSLFDMLQGRNVETMGSKNYGYGSLATGQSLTGALAPETARIDTGFKPSFDIDKALFGEAFSKARGQGLDEFTWMGDRFHTRYEGE